MKHLGDITKISGYTVPPVDVIIGGSPCQDLSVAGKRAGLKGKRSGLFMEQIRIIKEMREASANGADEIKPRYMVWENVPGAFSSNRGEDFRAVLEETVRIADENAVIPRPACGKWRTCGCILGDGFSVSWRVFDAQFWGVPQRRRRIALVADFGGASAPEILFERKGVSGSASAGGETRERAAAGIETDVKNAVFDISQRTDGIRVYKDISPTISALAGTGGNNVPLCFGVDTYNQCETGDKAKSLVSKHSDTDGLPVVCYSLDRAAFNQGINAKYDPSITADGISQTLVSKGLGAVCYGVPLNFCPENMRPQEEIAATICNGTAPGTHNGVIRNYKVRRLTPLECERLQGYPDDWTSIGRWTDSKGKKHNSTDAARYKALGNSIALPSWRWVLKRICMSYDRPATMASLFDGIGGFPLIWEEINGKGSCLWASEIEEFSIAVTKRHFDE